MLKHRKLKVWKAYLDGEILCEDVLQTALDNHKMLDDMKKILVEENPNHKVTFRLE